MDYIEQRAAKKFTDLAPDVAARKRRLMVQESLIWGGFVGGSTKEQTLKFLWLDQVTQGENPFVAGTYSKILAEIARNATKHADVKLEHPVDGISFDKSQGSVKVSVKGGRSESFDEVILTTPLGWLKRNLSLIEPPLPARVSKAIRSVGYGILDKVCASSKVATNIA